VSAPVTWEELGERDLRDFTLRTVPSRVAALGDPHAGIDEAPCALDPLLELSVRHEAEGLGDPWPPHYAKGDDEPRRVSPSRARRPTGQGRRQPRLPLRTVAKAAREDEALAGLEGWKARHPEAARYLEPADVLVPPKPPVLPLARP